MAGYSGTPLWKKLGYKAGVSAYVEGEPSNYISLLTVTRRCGGYLASPGEIGNGIRASVRDVCFPAEKQTGIRIGKKIVPGGVIWVSWPKKSSGVTSDITEDTIRDLALPMGLVDVKVCAVDEVWSGLKLVIRRTERTA